MKYDRGSAPASGQCTLLMSVGRALTVGTDVNIVTLSLSVHHSLDVAEKLAGEGISVEVLDLRSLVPLGP